VAQYSPTELGLGGLSSKNNGDGDLIWTNGESITMGSLYFGFIVCHFDGDTRA
jgi:hypothetical protein